MPFSQLHPVAKKTFLLLGLISLTACFEPDTWQKIRMARPHTQNAVEANNMAFDETRDDIRHNGYSCAGIQFEEICRYPEGLIRRLSCGPASDPDKVYPDEIYFALEDERVIVGFHRVVPGAPYNKYEHYKGDPVLCPKDPFPSKPPVHAG